MVPNIYSDTYSSGSSKKVFSKTTEYLQHLYRSQLVICLRPCLEAAFQDLSLVLIGLTVYPQCSEKLEFIIIILIVMNNDKVKNTDETFIKNK